MNTQRMISVTVYVTPGQHESLRALSKLTRVAAAEYVRAGVDYVLAQHAEQLSAPAAPTAETP